MSITYSTAGAGGRLAAALTQTDTAPGASVDGQAGNGVLIFFDAQGHELVLLTLRRPSFAIADGVATLLGPLIESPSLGGTPALAALLDGSSATVISGLTVGPAGSGCDIIAAKDLVTTIPFQVGSLVITGGQ